MLCAIVLWRTEAFIIPKRILSKIIRKLNWRGVVFDGHLRMTAGGRLTSNRAKLASGGEKEFGRNSWTRFRYHNERIVIEYELELVTQLSTGGRFRADGRTDILPTLREMLY
ncbi:hypothetical protein KQX54_010185 [Cotesia glomerata]|uniref:Uncharacterized protein n=1 Tax=Cotesia glomerata TaxID=32391 RepID=A0AAV7I6M0_COTGL|nr:hypothetical protein KQX54_010185 [Cotesia glomerata]